MTAKTAKLITPERVKKLFECYGSNPDCWPVDEKVSALSLIQHSSELRELQKEVAGFDKLLKDADMSAGFVEPSDTQFLQSIVNELPQQETKQNPRFTNRVQGNKRLFFDVNSSVGLIAASVAIVAITLSIVNLKPDRVHQVGRTASTSVTVNTELDNWMWEQVSGVPADESDEPLTMMALLELGEI